MAELSPAAQAVLNAAHDGANLVLFDIGNDSPVPYCAAAVLRAAADQAENVNPAKPSTEWGEGWLEGIKDVVAGFRRIANELEAQ